MTDLKILIVGLGSIGRRHMKNLSRLGVKRLAALTAGHCTLPPDDLPPYLSFSGMDAALDWRPNAIFVCNPTALHLDTALEAVQAGCHIYLEKPVSHTMDGLSDLDALVEQQGVKLQVGFQYRYHFVLQEIRKRIQEGHIGKVVSAHAHWGEYLPGWHPWEDYRTSYSARRDLGGGVVLTLCHPFDYLRWMLGEIEVVQALGGHLSDMVTDTEDTALVALRFAEGAIGSVYLDYVSRPPKHTLQIIGDDGRIEWDADSGGAKVYREGGRAFETISPGRFFERNEMFSAAAADFLNAIYTDRPPACTLSDGIAALKIALQARALLELTAPILA
jgi:predicted dehydrogenase